MAEREGFACDFPGCDKVYPKQWRLREHQCSTHTGEVQNSKPDVLISIAFLLFSDHLSVDMKDALNRMLGVLI